MCNPPAPETFEKMDLDERVNTLYGVVLKLSARARFTNKWGIIALTFAILPSAGWVWTDSMSQNSRTEKLEDRVERRAVQDSLTQMQILMEVKAMGDALDDLHPRGSRR